MLLVLLVPEIMHVFLSVEVLSVFPLVIILSLCRDIDFSANFEVNRAAFLSSGLTLTSPPLRMVNYRFYTELNKFLFGYRRCIAHYNEEVYYDSKIPEFC